MGIIIQGIRQELTDRAWELLYWQEEKPTPKEITDPAPELQDRQKNTQQKDFDLVIDNDFLKKLNQKASERHSK